MNRSMRVAIPLLALLAWVVPAAAQVVRQITDERTTLSGPGAMDDSGTAVWTGASADFAGENPDHAFQIVRFDPATGTANPVTDVPGGTAAIVSVSDDGEWLAFVSPANLTGDNPDESLELFVMRANGTETTQLTDDPAPNAGSVGAVAISGDGSRVVFVANTDPLGTNPALRDQIFVVGRDGSGLTQVTQIVDGGIGAVSVSDDGSRIAFGHDGDPSGSNLDLGGEVFAVDADGSNLRQLTVTPAGFSSSAPVLCGNGTRIAFQSNGDLTGGNAIGQTEVFVVDWTGANLRQLTATTAVIGILGDPTSQLPSITDDGAWVYYFSNQSSLFPLVNLDGNFEIFRIRNDGTSRQQLTSTILDGGSVYPVVSGDGSRVAYYGIGTEITLGTIAGTGGSSLALLTFDPVFVSEPAVSPDGSLAVYVRQDGLFGTAQMWRVGTDGAEAARIGGDEIGSPSSPSIAGDASTVVFASAGDPTAANADGSTEIFRIGTDGTGIAQLTSGPADTASGRPVVSTDGAVVAFDSDADLTGGNADLSREVFAVGIDGTGLVQLTDGPVGTESRAPAIDATGTWVVFESNADLDGSNADGTFEIFRIRSDGSGLESITADPLVDARRPDISGAGDRIVYSSSADPLGSNPEGNPEIFAWRADTLARAQLTSFAEGSSGAAVVDGSGTWVYFSSDAAVFEDDPDRPSDLYRVPVDGGTIERVGALRRGAPAALPGGLGIGGGGVAVDDSGDVAVFSGVGDFTEDNPDGLPELWAIDRTAVPVLVVGKDAPTALSWSHESGPLRYDVVRGDVASLADGGDGTVDLGTVVCIENDSPDADTIGFEDPEEPVPGQAFFYVHRGTQGLLDGPGSYGTASDGRVREAGGGDCAP
jgi:Tol biopolymer transport system component